MTDERIWTSAELEEMTPDQRAAVVREGVVTELGQLDDGLVERARAYGRDLLEAGEPSHPRTSDPPGDAGRAALLRPA